MEINGSFKARSIEVSGGGYRNIDVEVTELAVDNILPSDVVKEFSVDELLDEIGSGEVIRWLENNGYTVKEED